MAPSTEFLTLQPVVAGRYALDREIGRGGMGVVFLARDVALERPVAIKLLLPHLANDPNVRERFLREAQTAARLMHPNIVPIHSVEAHGDLVFFVMAFVDGETLAQRVARTGPLPGKDVMAIARDVAWALGYAHARGIVHRDIKPDNVLIERDSGRAMVADFGIARVEHQGGLTSDGAFVGTVQYMSPEQASTEAVDGRTDVYSLGATAYFALTGAPPVDGPSLPVALHRLMTAEPEPVALVRTDLPPGLGDIVMRAMAKDRTARFETADHLATALRDADPRAPAVRPEVHAFLRSIAQSRVLIVLGGLTAAAAPALWWAGAVSTQAAIAMSVGGVVGAAYFTVLAAVAPLARLRNLGVTFEEVSFGVREELRITLEATQRQLTPAAVRSAAKPLGWLFAGMGTMNVAVLANAAITKPWDRGWLMYSALVVSVGLASAGISLLRDKTGTSLLARLMTSPQRRKTSSDGLLRAVAWLLERKITRRLFTPLGGEVAAPTGPIAPAPTATLLLQRVEQLVGQLPRDVQSRLGDAVAVASALERAGTLLRQRLATIDGALSELQPGSAATTEFTAARGRIAVRLAECVAALDLLRTDLLRMNAGLLAADGLTLALEQAKELGAAIDAELHGRAEVQRLVG